MDKSSALELYRKTFPDDDIPFETALFDNCFKYCRYIKENGKIISMLFALPCKIQEENIKTECVYIYAAATLKEYRKKGYMAKLLEEVKKSNSVILLRPANESLIEFYKKFGFRCITMQKTNTLPCVHPEGGFKYLAEKFAETETGEKFTAMYFSSLEKEYNNLNFLYSME